MGQLHLEAPGGAGGPLGKDVENQFTAVAHRQIEEPLQIAGLHRCELPVCHYQGGAEPPGLQGRFTHFPLTPEGLGGNLAAALLHHSHRHGTGAAYESLQFGDQALGPAAVAWGEG